MGGVENFPRNIYVEEIINMKQKSKTKAEDFCKKHRLPVSMFCEHKDCKEIYCPKCILAEHKDHKALDVLDKVEEIKENLMEKKSVITAIKSPIITKMQKIEEIVEEINISASKALDEINYSKGVILREYEEAMQQVRNQADLYTMKVIEHHKKQLARITKPYNELTKRKEALEDCWFMIGKFFDNAPNDIVRNSEAITNVYLKAAHEPEETTNHIEYYELPKFTRNLSIPRHAIPLLGQVSMDHKDGHCANGIQCNGDIGSRRSCLLESIDENNDNLYIPKRAKTISATHVNSWKGERDLIASNEMGMLYNIGGDRLQAFNSGGKLRMEVGLKERAVGITCLRNMLILTNDKSIHLRDGSTGEFLDKLVIPHFEPSGGGICQGPGNTVLISNASDIPPSRLIEITVENGKLKQTKKMLTIPLIRIKGLGTICHAARKLVIGTSPDSYATVAVDYETGAKIWHIHQALHDGQLIRPWGICSDNSGHLYMSDRENNRVVEVSTIDFMFSMF